jgi:hypothetical protein
MRVKTRHPDHAWRFMEVFQKYEFIMNLAKIKIAGTQYDRRCKLTEEQKQAIREEYAKGAISMATLGKKYGVSRAYVSLLLDREKMNRVKETGRLARAQGKYRKTPEEAKKYAEEHKAYKKKLYNDYKI